MRGHGRGALAGVALALTISARGADAQVLMVDPSVRAAGMGGTATAVFWSGDLDEWANPALLGYTTGFQYRWSRTRLVPSLPDDAFLSGHQIHYGFGGMGIAGGNNALDYGRLDLTNSSGVMVGTFEPRESARTWGIGFSLSRFVEAVRVGEHPAMWTSRWGPPRRM